MKLKVSTERRETLLVCENREHTQDSLRRNHFSEAEGAERMQTALTTTGKINTRRSSTNLPTHPFTRSEALFVLLWILRGRYTRNSANLAALIDVYPWRTTRNRAEACF